MKVYIGFFNYELIRFYYISDRATPYTASTIGRYLSKDGAWMENCPEVARHYSLKEAKEVAAKHGYEAVVREGVPQD